jgi:hypothetical protein
MNPRSGQINKWIAYGLQAFVLLGLVLVPLAAWGQGFTPPSAGHVETPAILRTCAVMPDQQLKQYRGCYDTYYFGMDIGVNISGRSTPGITVNFVAMVPDGSAAPVANSSGTQVAFNSGQVSFSAGIGRNSLGSGIYQVTQVAGNNNLVIAAMNININIANADRLRNPAAISLAGLR